MKQQSPDYYKNFRCIASACRHSCCIGWEIDVDEDTAGYYKTVTGKLGDKLRRCISNDGESNCFILDKNERCPFLDSNNLCEIIKELGEDSLCQICRDHPRYRNFYSDREEIGIGLSCEEAARIIVEKSDKTTVIELFDDGYDEETDQYDREFFKLRERVFEILQNRSKRINERLCEMAAFCGIKECLPDFCECAKIHSELEFLDKKQHNIYLEMSKKECRAELQQEFDTAFEQLAVYFVFRHFAKITEGEKLENTAFLCAVCTKMIMYLCEYHKAVNGTLTLSDIGEIARAYSCETEYSEENTETIMNMLDI